MRDHGSLTLLSVDFADLNHNGDIGEQTPFDLGEDQRAEDGDGNGSFIVDIGAYEFSPNCKADLNSSGGVDAADLAILLGAWGRCPDPPDPCVGNLNGGGQDAAVNAADLAILLGAWGLCDRPDPVCDCGSSPLMSGSGGSSELTFTQALALMGFSSTANFGEWLATASDATIQEAGDDLAALLGE